MLRLASFLRNPFAFLFAGTSREERVAEYVIRQHHKGRRLDDVIGDRYVQNRLSPQQQARLIERPDVIRAVGDDDLEAARRYLADIAG